MWRHTERGTHSATHGASYPVKTCIIQTLPAILPRAACHGCECSCCTLNNTTSQALHITTASCTAQQVSLIIGFCVSNLCFWSILYSAYIGDQWFDWIYNDLYFRENWYERLFFNQITIYSSDSGVFQRDGSVTSWRSSDLEDLEWLSELTRWT